jgi:hypothetical protein
MRWVQFSEPPTENKVISIGSRERLKVGLRSGRYPVERMEKMSTNRKEPESTSTAPLEPAYERER